MPLAELAAFNITIETGSIDAARAASYTLGFLACEVPVRLVTGHKAIDPIRYLFFNIPVIELEPLVMAFADHIPVLFPRCCHGRNLDIDKIFLNAVSRQRVLSTLELLQRDVSCVAGRPVVVVNFHFFIKLA